MNWRSPASAASADGASDSYYLSLPQPYNCKNSPFETVEELLLVEGVTPQLLYGDDTNRNGILDPNEFDIDAGRDRIERLDGDRGGRRLEQRRDRLQQPAGQHDRRRSR